MPDAVFGNRKVYCNGNIYLGNRNCQAYFTLFLLGMLPVLTLIFGLQSYRNEHYYWVIVFSIVILNVLSVGIFLVVFFSDPGIYVKPLNEVGNEDMSMELKMVDYNGKMYALKYCSACKLHRPLRSSHCRVCDVCVEELDHHCPWIANCIGRRNRGLFLWLLVVSLILSVELQILIITDLQMAFQNYDEESFMRTYLIEIIIGCLGFVLSTGIVVLLWFQLWLIGKGLTTHECLKNVYEGIDNPFNEGCFRNYFNFWRKNTTYQAATVEYYKNYQKMNPTDDSTVISDGSSGKEKQEINIEITTFKTNQEPES